ncbi:MAG: hypothetical protein PHV95_01420 [Eubacteriales bacterium]|nr:hypothetical protein [Eubacteriales bacterium]
MLKKTIAFILVLMAIVSVLVSCANSDTSDVNSSKNSSYGMGTDNSYIEETSNEVSNVASDDLSELETSPGDIASQINGYFDIIFSTNPKKLESEIAEEFPEEFAAIVAFGEKAFPTLDEIISKGNNDIYRTALAYFIKYTIKPDLYDEVFPSSNEKYLLKMLVDSFLDVNTIIGTTYKLELFDRQTNYSILKLDEVYSNISVDWSTDNRYISISFGDRYYHLVDVIDVQNSKLIKLPNENEVESIIKERLINTYNPSDFSLHFLFSEWLAENKIKIRIDLFSDAATKADEGWYIYDLAKKEIVEIDMQKSEVSR